MDPLDSRSVGQKFSNFVDRLGGRLAEQDFEMGCWTTQVVTGIGVGTNDTFGDGFEDGR